ncbi:MAG: PDZ domain-containing protein [Rhodospirillales bacterium]
MLNVFATCRALGVGCVMALSVFVGQVSLATAEDRGFLGMNVQGNSPKIAAALGLESAIGVFVRDISIDGPAAHAGIARGDLITKLHGTPIDTFERLLQVAGTLQPGDKVDVEIMRLGKLITVQMQMSAWPDGWNIEQSAFAAQPELGVTFAALTPKMRNHMGIRWGSTGIVVSVFNDLFAGLTSLRRGDVVAQVNQKPVWEPKQFLEAYDHAKKEGRQALLLLVERPDGFKYMLQPIIQAMDNNNLKAPVFKLPGQK